MTHSTWLPPARFGLLLAALAVPTACTSDSTPSALIDTGDLAMATPEAQGYASSQLDAVGAYAASIHSPAGLVLVGDQVIYGWGDVAERLAMHGVRRSFLSALYGQAVDSGAISLQATLADLDIQDVPALTAEEQSATVQQLLQERSGVYHAANYESASEIAALPPRDSHVPGTFWWNNVWNTNAAGAIYEQQTGTSIFDAFQTQIATPLGMQDYSPADGDYLVDGAGLSTIPAFTFAMTARDMARFGLLYLHGGSWLGQQIVPADWFAASTQIYTSTTNKAGAGYGYLWWIAEPGSVTASGDNVSGTLAAIGTGGHMVVVLPAYDMVVVVQADDEYYEQDPAANGIGEHRTDELLSLILAARAS
jgi:CubicO group peptidase (beta-lactamase class C family)